MAETCSGTSPYCPTDTYKVSNTSLGSPESITVSSISDGSGSLLSAFKAANGGSATIISTMGNCVTTPVTQATFVQTVHVT